MSRVLKVAEIEGRGRSLVATQPLKGGDIILRDSPILLYSALPIQQNSPSYYCHSCFRFITTPSPSSCCDHHVFCSPKCRSTSTSPWVCQALAQLKTYNWAQLDQSLERQTQALFLIAAYNLAFVSPPKFQLLLSLEGRDSDSDSAIAQFLHPLVSPLVPPFHGLSVELTAALLGKDMTNAFGLTEPLSKKGERSVRAYGIYPNASFFNHDCLPNACRFDYVDSNMENNTDIVVRMIHDVPQGTEICLSYFPVNENYAYRQKRLLEDYQFACNCDRCKVEANWSDNDDENEAVMDEDDDGDDEQMGDDVEDHMGDEGDNEENGNDFPHAYFFLKYMCIQENCGGTLAPLPRPDAVPSSIVMECNACGILKSDEEIGAAGGD